jgi:uncharacterized membrane protein
MNLLSKLQPGVPRWMHRIDRRKLVGAAMLGGIAHICATFAAPVLATFAVPVLGSTAYLRLRDSLPLNRMVALPLPAPGRQFLPFLPPDMLYAMCRYELTGGPIAVTAALTDAGGVLSLHTPQGDNFYVLPGQLLRRAEVSFLVVPGGGGEAALVQQHATAADTQVASPTLEGLIVVRLPLRGLAWQAETEALLQQASCTQVKR